MKLPELSEVVLHRLARQVEYYFSAANLSKDTYVSTLRSLNDGYVPISIIANFGKVKSLVPYDGFNAVRKAATEFSDLLEIVEINTQTGKRVSETEPHNDTAEPPSTLEAVGPIGGQPIPLSKIAASPVSSPTNVKLVSSVQNTVIIREVPQSTEEAHVRELFTFESCPSIQSLHLDVGNCWSVYRILGDDTLNI
jgi:metal-sulfur cluster biosynthetic enzyme